MFVLKSSGIWYATETVVKLAGPEVVKAVGAEIGKKVGTTVVDEERRDSFLSSAKLKVRHFFLSFTKSGREKIKLEEAKKEERKRFSDEQIQLQIERKKSLSEVLREPEHLKSAVNKLKEVNLSDDEEQLNTFEEVIKNNKKKREEKQEQCNAF